MSYADKSDEELGALVAHGAGSSEAHAPFQELYGRLGTLTERFIAARIHAKSVPDVHQETWQKAWKNAAQFCSQVSYRAWLLEIARNTIIDTARYQGRRPEKTLPESDDLALGNSSSPDAQLIDAEEQSVLRDCLEELSDRARELVQGRLQGISYAELCRQLSLSEAAAHKMYFNSRRALQDCVKKKMP